jgi:hypothetical protein
MKSAFLIPAACNSSTSSTHALKEVTSYKRKKVKSEHNSNVSVFRQDNPTLASRIAAK